MKKNSFLFNWFAKKNNLQIQYVILGILLLFVGYFIYAPLFSSPFYHDDIIVIVQNDWVRHVPPGTWFAQSFTDSQHIFHLYRPTLMMSYWLNHILIPGNLEFSLRLGSLLLLALNGYLVGKIASRFFSKEDRFSAWMIAAVYILHPIQTLAVAYAWKRSSLLCTFFILLGTLSYIRKKTEDRPSHFLFILFQILCFAGAITSKEEGMVYLLMMSACEVLFSTPASTSARNKTGTALFLITIGIGVDVLIHKYTSTHIWNIISEPFRVVYFKQSLFVIASYFKDMIIPSPVLFGQMSPPSQWINSQSCITLGLFFISFIALFFSRVPTLIKLALLFIWIGFLPNSTFQPLLFAVDQIRMNLPLVGFSILLVYLLRKIPSQKIFFISSGIICLIFAVQSFRQSVRFTQPVLIWKDVVTKYPQSILAWSQLGNIYEQKGNFALAANAYESAYTLDPAQIEQRILALGSRLRAGESREAIIQESRSIHLSTGQSSFAYLQLGLLQFDLGLLDEAEKSIQLFLKYYPQYSQAYFTLGVIYEQQHRYNLSREAYQKTLNLSPNHELARKALENLSAR